MNGIVLSLAGVLVAVAAAWCLLVAILWLHRPSRDKAGLLLRIVPDLVRLTWRLGRDQDTPTRYRVALGVLGVYLALPIDLIPDFLPGLGALDDVILAGLVLRWVGRGVGRERIDRQWSGSPEGLELLHQLLGSA